MSDPKSIANNNNNNNDQNLVNKNTVQDPQLSSQFQARRRNALTPEAHHLDPIRQTEIQEKMSSLNMSGGGETGESSGAQQQ